VTIVGVDAGGTFTDFFVAAGPGTVTHKVLSTPDDPARAVVEGLTDLGLNEQPLLLLHGTTVATNAVLEGHLARTVYVTHRGFADVLALGRQQRRSVYALEPRQPPPPVPPELCLETSGRRAADGAVLEPLRAADLDEFAARLKTLEPEAVAINLLHAWRFAADEDRLAAACPPGIPVSRSSAVLPIAGEYERGIATWLNAALSPLLAGYVAALAERLPKARLAVMQSDGTMCGAAQAAARPVELLLSGPAGGAAAAAWWGQRLGIPALLCFDMGGTSTDVTLVRGEPELSQDGTVGDWPVALPMIAIHTIGAGGGSLAAVDAGGLLKVGPRSAGAVPGPASYGRGGQEATVTDAHVVLGRIPVGTRLSGRLELDAAAARGAVGRLSATLDLSLERAAQGIVTIASEQMARALRVVSAERGHDPAACVLFSFGGAGGLHACELAERLGIGRILIAPGAGVLSAFGLTVAPPGRRRVHSILEPLTGIDRRRLAALATKIERAASAEMAAENVASPAHRRWVGLRFQGQRQVLEVEWDAGDWRAAFLEQYRQRHGTVLDGEIEVAHLHVASRGAGRPIQPAPPARSARHERATTAVWIGREWHECPVLGRQEIAGGIAGPAVIAGDNETIWVAPGWRAAGGADGECWLTAAGEALT